MLQDEDLHRAFTLIDGCRNLAKQPITRDSRIRLFRLLDEMTMEAWINARGTIITSTPVVTLWAATSRYTGRADMPSSPETILTAMEISFQAIDRTTETKEQ